jgi:hypothetical protein
LGQDEAEFEVARRYVRFSASAARNAALSPRRGQPLRLARAATFAAARRHARGVARSFPAHARPGPWYWPLMPYPVPSYPPAGPSLPPGEPSDPASNGKPAAGAGPADPGAGAFGAPPPSGAEPADSGGMEMEFEGSFGSGGKSGRWIRRGRRIVVIGV